MHSYRKSAFGKIFPPTVFRGSRQSPTIRWICNRCADGRGVVTPRDILDLSIRAKQRQQDLYVCMPQIQTVHRTTSLAQPQFNTGSRNCQNANERLISKPNFRISGRTSESSWGARLTTTQLRFRYFLGRNGRLSLNTYWPLVSSREARNSGRRYFRFHQFTDME